MSTHFFQIGDHVEVTGKLARLFAGEQGVIVGIEFSRPRDPKLEVYLVSFSGEENRLPGRHLTSKNRRSDYITS